ncbi:hypothetical protein PInf_021050 [Phytophthora infestans]|nr:hypothetical protein PInf_021050 [Phytophthora infestans]
MKEVPIVLNGPERFGSMNSCTAVSLAVLAMNNMAVPYPGLWCGKAEKGLPVQVYGGALASDTDHQDAEASRSCQRADSSAYSKIMHRCGNATGMGLLPGVWTCYTSSVQRRRPSRRTGFESGYAFKH